MNAFLIYLIVLRIVHIVGGTCWLGGAIIHNLFVEPTVKATAPSVRKMSQVGRIEFVLMLVSLLTMAIARIWPNSGI